MNKKWGWLAADAAGAVLAFIAGAAFSYVNSRRIYQKKEAEIERYKGYFNTLNQWMHLKQGGVSVARYLRQMGWRTVAVYGLGELGQHLCRELYGEGIRVEYGIDRNADDKEAIDFCSGIHISDLGHEFTGVDAVIVTLPHLFQSLQGSLAEKFRCPVLDLERVLFEVQQEDIYAGAGRGSRENEKPGVSQCHTACLQCGEILGQVHGEHSGAVLHQYGDFVNQ